MNILGCGLKEKGRRALACGSLELCLYVYYSKLSEITCSYFSTAYVVCFVVDYGDFHFCRGLTGFLGSGIGGYLLILQTHIWILQMWGTQVLRYGKNLDVGRPPIIRPPTTPP